MPDCNLCQQVSVTPSHNNYRECNYCLKFFLCINVAIEHVAQCKQKHSECSSSGSKRSRSPHIQSCGKRANGASDHYVSSPSGSGAQQNQVGGSRTHQDHGGGPRAHQDQGGGSRAHRDHDEEEEPNTFTPFQKKRKRACFKELQTYFDYEYTSITADMIHFLNDTRPILKNHLLNYFKQHGSLKFCWPFNTLWRKKDGTTFNHIFRSKTQIYLQPPDFSELWDYDYSNIEKKFDEFMHNGSENVLEAIETLHIEIYKYDPTLGASYIPTPEKYVQKKAIINVQNRQDNFCLLYSCSAKKIYRVGDTHRETPKKYKEHIKTWNVKGISFPTPIHQIPKFEEQNNITVNLYITESNGKTIRPVKISKRSQSDPINLLLIVDRETGTFNNYIAPFIFVLNHV